MIEYVHRFIPSSRFYTYFASCIIKGLEPRHDLCRAHDSDTAPSSTSIVKSLESLFAVATPKLRERESLAQKTPNRFGMFIKSTGSSVLDDNTISIQCPRQIKTVKPSVYHPQILLPWSIIRRRNRSTSLRNKHQRHPDAER